MAITRRQKEVIDFLSGFTQKNGYSPSYEEIAAITGLPDGTVKSRIHRARAQLRALVEKAMISVVISGSTKLGSVKSVTKFASVAAPALLEKA